MCESVYSKFVSKWFSNISEPFHLSFSRSDPGVEDVIPSSAAIILYLEHVLLVHHVVRSLVIICPLQLNTSSWWMVVVKRGLCVESLENPHPDKWVAVQCCLKKGGCCLGGWCGVTWHPLMLVLETLKHFIREKSQLPVVTFNLLLAIGSLFRPAEGQEQDQGQKDRERLSLQTEAPHWPLGIYSIYWMSSGNWVEHELEW